MKTYVNTFIFNEEYSIPMRQETLFDELRRKGFEEIEIRREYIGNKQSELPIIAQKAREAGVVLYYAIVDTYYKDGILDRDIIDVYVEEAVTLGAKTIKLMPGDYRGMSSEEADYLRGINKLGVRLLLENGQKSTPEQMRAFASECEAEGIALGITFDLGNWVWSGQDIPRVAELLKPWVKSVHLKDGAEIDGVLKVVPIGEGVTDWMAAAEILRDASFAIEYSCGSPAIENMIKELDKLNSLS
ncbi:MAG: xylose isomerase-like barrel family protein [Bacillota bacterium]|jgi:sugar phosphate isomerase/epimerase|nr:xylose isomerase-like barrel family protein [Bacillota bacterium]